MVAGTEAAGAARFQHSRGSSDRSDGRGSLRETQSTRSAFLNPLGLKVAHFMVRLCVYQVSRREYDELLKQVGQAEQQLERGRRVAAANHRPDLSNPQTRLDKYVEYETAAVDHSDCVCPVFKKQFSPNSWKWNHSSTAW